MKKFLPLGLFVVLVGFLYVGLGLDPKKLPSPFIGKEFPNLKVVDFDTNEQYFTQEKLKNNLTLVNVWASWCVTCKAEHDMLMHIAKLNTVNMLGVNYKDTKKNGKFFLQRLGDPYDSIIFDKDGKLGLELGVYATPETFLVDRDGVIRYKRVGQLTPSIWRDDILPLISELKNINNI